MAHPIFQGVKMPELSANERVDSPMEGVRFKELRGTRLLCKETAVKEFSVSSGIISPTSTASAEFCIGCVKQVGVKVEAFREEDHVLVQKAMRTKFANGWFVIESDDVVAKVEVL